MPAITIQDLENAKRDTDHIAAIATSTALVATDRLGHAKRTITGTEAFIDARLAQVGAEASAVLAGMGYLPPLVYAAGLMMTSSRQTVAYEDNTYAPVADALPFTTSGTFEVDKFRLLQGVSGADLAADSGASMVGTLAGRSVQQEITSIKRGWIIGDDFPTLKAAIAFLQANYPMGGTIAYGSRNDYKTGDWHPYNDYMGVDNVHVLGTVRPYFNQDCSRLIGGTAFQGRFNVFAHNFRIENCGFDMGRYVIDTYYGGASTHEANHPLGETWDAFPFAQPNQAAPLAPRRNLVARNIIGLCKDSETVGHAVLLEGYNSAEIDGIVGMYSFHPVVIKGSGASVGRIAGYGAKINHVIIKSDAYALGVDIRVDQIETGRAPPGTTPWATPWIAQYGVHINPATAAMGKIKLGMVRCYGAKSLFAVVGNDLGSGVRQTIDGLDVGSLEIEGAGSEPGVLGISMYQAAMKRMRMGRVTVINGEDGLAYKNDASLFASEQLNIDQLELVNVTGRGIQALGYGQVVISQLRANGVGQLYDIAANARVLVGVESVVGVTSRWGGNAPLLGAGWANFGAGEGYDFEVRLSGFEAKLFGLLRNTGSGGANVFTLPAFLRPPRNIRRIVEGRDTDNSIHAIDLTIQSNGICVINGAVGTGGASLLVALDGISYPLI